MNKAFIKEPESTGAANCPRCGSLGIPVGDETLQAQLEPERRGQISSPAYFCPFATCEVAYFDDFERSVPASALLRPVYPKDPDAPLCACFGLTADDVELDLAEGGVGRVRALLEKARSPEARCAILAASGQCCVADVQRYYMKRRAETTGK
jgi:CopZ-like zinc binding protein